MNEMQRVPQYVPQDVCLSCDGCCRFKEAGSSWRPRISMDQVYDLRLKQPSLAQKIFNQTTIDSKSYVRTKEGCQSCSCKFFDNTEKRCGIYDVRPFECAFYPFLLHRVDNHYFVGVHLACPHILDTRYDKTFDTYLETLKNYIFQSDVIKFLSHNKHLFSAYKGHEQEIEKLFELPISEDSGDEKFLNQRFAFEWHLSGQSFSESPFAFNAVFNWKDFFDFDFQVIDDCLCVFAGQDGEKFLYLPPIGKFNAATLDKCFTIMKGNTARIDNVPQALLKHFPVEHYKHFQKGHEYCYYKKDLIELKGNAYKTKRSALNHFTKHYTYEYRLYGDGRYQECLDLYQRWKDYRAEAHHDDIYRHMLIENGQVHRTALKYYRELGLLGRVVYVNGKLSGYTFGYPVGNDVFCVLFEITDLSVKGLSIFIFNQLCQDEVLRPYRFINAMDDSFQESLKKVKESFRPKILLPLYTITEK